MSQPVNSFAESEEYPMNSPGSNSERYMNPTPTSGNPGVSTLSLNPRNGSYSGVLPYISRIPEKMKGNLIADLSERLENNINSSLLFPIEYLESTLFDLCKRYYSTIDPNRPILGVLASLHPIQTLLEIDDINISKWNDLLEKYLLYNPNSIEELEFIKSFIQFINDLSIVWDISNVYHYRHRFSYELEDVKLINIEALFTAIINPEIIWLSTTVNNYPLQEILNDEIKTLAIMLQSKFIALFSSFMRSNMENLAMTDSIQPWLSYINPELHKKYCFARPEKDPKPAYQHLSNSFSLKFWQKKPISLKQDLEDFEFLYRQFEASLLKSLCKMLTSPENITKTFQFHY